MRPATSSFSTTRIGRSGTKRRSRTGSAFSTGPRPLGGPGPYQLQAVIAAAHAQDRDASAIVSAYAALVELDPSPVVRLNHAVAVGLAGDPETALALIAEIDGLDEYHYRDGARGELLRRVGQVDAASVAYERALSLTESEAERRFYRMRLEELAVSPRVPTASCSRCESTLEPTSPAASGDTPGTDP